MYNKNKIDVDQSNNSTIETSTNLELNSKLKNVVTNMYWNCELVSHMSYKIKREHRTNKELNEIKATAYASYSAIKTVYKNFKPQDKLNEEDAIKYNDLIASFSNICEKIGNKLREFAVTDIGRTTSKDLASSFASKIDFYTSEGCDKKQSVRKAFEDSIEENINAYFCLSMAGAYDKNNDAYLVNINNVRQFEEKAKQKHSQCDFEMNG